MTHSRRRLLAIAGVASTLVGSVGVWWRHRSRPAPRDEDAQIAFLRAWIDTLMPVDPEFPGALALGVADKISAALERDKAYQALTREAIVWLNQKAQSMGGAPFATLDASARERVVAVAEAQAVGSAPYTFFQATRDDVLFHAYADPRAWAGLGYAGPPQPIGFPAHDRAPAKL